ncbi:MAG: YihY/virulence factor BrkB family protein [Actinomycetota bacterium]|nr:YihY/virulence factor BrkB family protein [Actinomycetota bacterium]
MSDDVATNGGRLAGVKRRAGVLVEDLGRRRDDARERIPAVDISFAALDRDTQMGGFVLAGALAFRLFVYLLPLYLLILVIAGAALSVDPDSPRVLATTAGVSASLATMVSEAAATSKRSIWILVPVTLAALAIAANSAYKVVHSAHVRAWDLTARRSMRSSASAAGGFLLASLFVVAGHFLLRNLRHGVLIPVAMVVGSLYYAGLWLVISHALPRVRRAGWWWLAPGALLVGLGTQGLYLFTVLYLNRRIESATEAYGALGVAASSLAWLYLVGRLVVAAPVLNATLWERFGSPEEP